MGSAPSQDAETVVLDLMNPACTGRRLFCDEEGRSPSTRNCRGGNRQSPTMESPK